MLKTIFFQKKLSISILKILNDPFYASSPSWCGLYLYSAYLYHNYFYGHKISVCFLENKNFGNLLLEKRCSFWKLLNFSIFYIHIKFRFFSLKRKYWSYVKNFFTKFRILVLYLKGFQIRMQNYAVMKIRRLGLVSTTVNVFSRRGGIKDVWVIFDVIFDALLG